MALPRYIATLLVCILTFASARVSTEEHQPTHLSGSASVKEHEMEQFIAAYTEIQATLLDYNHRLQQESNAENHAALQKEAQLKLRRALKARGLSSDEYAEWAIQVSEDAELRDRVARNMMEHGAQEPVAGTEPS